MELYTVYRNVELWEKLPTTPYESLSESEQIAWREYHRVAAMTNEELTAEIEELTRMIPKFEDTEVQTILHLAVNRYWQVYSHRLADELARIMFR